MIVHNVPQRILPCLHRAHLHLTSRERCVSCSSSTVRKDGSAETRGLREVNSNQPTLREQFQAQQYQRAVLRINRLQKSCLNDCTIFNSPAMTIRKVSMTRLVVQCCLHDRCRPCFLSSACMLYIQLLVTKGCGPFVASSEFQQHQKMDVAEALSCYVSVSFVVRNAMKRSCCEQLYQPIIDAILFVSTC
jgi:hypothetical protein